MASAEAALASDPANVQALIVKGNLLLKEDKLDEALALLTAGVAAIGLDKGRIDKSGALADAASGRTFVRRQLATKRPIRKKRLFAMVTLYLRGTALPHCVRNPVRLYLVPLQ